MPRRLVACPPLLVTTLCVLLVTTMWLQVLLLLLEHGLLLLYVARHVTRTEPCGIGGTGGHPPGPTAAPSPGRGTGAKGERLGLYVGSRGGRLEAA